MSTARTPPPEQQDGGGAGAGAAAPPMNPRGHNPTGPFVNRGEDVRAALENAERLVAQTTTQLAAEEARATALDQQVQAIHPRGTRLANNEQGAEMGRHSRRLQRRALAESGRDADDHEQMD